jgi:hypothetical protein
MKDLLIAHVVLLIAVSAYGFLAHTMRLSEIDDKRQFQIVVSDVKADDSYHWLQVEGCSADHTDDGVLCNQGWYGRSGREWRTGSKHTPVPFRDAPKGVLLRFEALVTDRRGKTVASASLITTRSF